MLLSFFRINDPYRLLGLLIIVILISTPHFIYPADILLSELKYSLIGEAINKGRALYTQVIDDTPPFAGLVYGFKDLLFGRSIITGKLIALAIIIFQSAYFAILLINNKAYAENTYVPALVFGLLSFISFDIISLSPELLASTVLLFALNQLFHEIEFKIQRDDIVLKLGSYIGISTFFVFSYGLFLIISIFILIAFARASIRKISLLLFGFLLPHSLLLLFYYYRGSVGLLWQNFYLSNLTLSGEMLISSKSLLFLSGVPLIYFLFSIFMMNREARFTKYQSQLMQVMFLWMLTGLIQILIAREVSATSLLPMIPPFAYFIGHYLLLIRRRWRAEIMLWIFLAGIVSVNFMSRFNNIESVNYAALFPANTKELTWKDKKIMSLGDELNIYSNNHLAGFFLNWDLSKGYFDNLSTYENVEMIARCFKSDPPEIILDKEGRFDKVLERLPYLRSQYKKKGLYWETNN